MKKNWKFVVTGITFVDKWAIYQLTKKSINLPDVVLDFSKQFTRVFYHFLTISKALTHLHQCHHLLSSHLRFFWHTSKDILLSSLYHRWISYLPGRSINMNEINQNNNDNDIMQICENNEMLPEE